MSAMRVKGCSSNCWASLPCRGLSNGTAPERSLQWRPALLTVPPLVVDQLPWLAPLPLAAQQNTVVL